MNIIARTFASPSSTGAAGGAGASRAPHPHGHPSIHLQDEDSHDEDFVSTLPSDLFDEEDVDIVLSCEAAPARSQTPSRFDAVVAWSHAQAQSRRGQGAAPMLPPRQPDAGPASIFHTPSGWSDRPAPRLQFTGTGSEYFRVWVVHLLFTVLTFGLYAAWAQRRQLQWWARHTLLDGDPFDFHGAPRRLLAHRLMGLVLILGAWLALLQPLWTGVAMMGVMALGAMALSMRVQRFRLHHLTWRGLRLGQRMEAAPRALSLMPTPVIGRSVLRRRGLPREAAQADHAGLMLLLSHAGLLVLTLGLYWPFLAVRLTRLRVDAMARHADELRAAMDTPALAQDTVADAPGERALGLDMGWSR